MVVGTWIAAAIVGVSVAASAWPRRASSAGPDAIPREAVQAWVARKAAARRAVGGEAIAEVPAYPVEAGLIRRELAKVGFHASQDPKILVLVLLYALVMLPLLVLLYGGFWDRPVAGWGRWLGVVGPLVALWWRRRKQLNQQVRRALSSALSMLASQLGSGRSFEVALVGTAEEMRGFVKHLAEELLIVSEHVRMGVPRAKAFEAMSARTGVAELGSMGRLLKADMSSALSPALRAYADLLEQKRMSAAEERAGKVPAKLTAVMIGTMIPPLMALLLAPAFITLYETWEPM